MMWRLVDLPAVAAFFKIIILKVFARDSPLGEACVIDRLRRDTTTARRCGKNVDVGLRFGGRGASISVL